MKLDFHFDKLIKQEYIKDVTETLTVEQLSEKVVNTGAGNPEALKQAHNCLIKVEATYKPPKDNETVSEHLLRAICGPAHEVV